MDAKTQIYAEAMLQALWMMESCEELEPTSALNQAATDLGIPEGDEMAEFIEWAFARMGL